MKPTGIGIAIFAFTLGGALLGMWLRSRLPDGHLDGESKDTVKLGVGLIATMTALILGLVTASAKSSFDAMSTGVRQSAVEVLALDRLLARYGSETHEIRAAMKQALEQRIEMVWPKGSSEHAQLDPFASGTGAKIENLADRIHALNPRDDAQRSIRTRALGVAEAILQSRWLVLTGAATSVPTLFL